MPRSLFQSLSRGGERGGGCAWHKAGEARNRPDTRGKKGTRWKDGPQERGDREQRKERHGAATHWISS